VKTYQRFCAHLDHNSRAKIAGDRETEHIVRFRYSEAGVSERASTILLASVTQVCTIWRSTRNAVGGGAPGAGRGG
jgi:hypothetical protein